MQFRLIFLVLMILVSSVQCDDETVKPKPYPFVITKPVNVFSNGATFIADILDVGKMPIKKYGFIIIDQDLPSKKTFIGVEPIVPKEGEYSATLMTGMQKDHNYEVMAYMETENYTVFGNVKSFKSQGSLPPKIVSYTPHEGPIGTVVEITGENIGPMRSGLSIKFGDKEAIIDTVINDRIFVKVPAVLENGNLTITLETAGVTATSATPFDVWFPWTRKADFPGSYLWRISSFEIGGKIYVLGGLNINPWQIQNEFWVYDTEVDRWSQKAPFPGLIRYGAVAFSNNSKGYYGLGRNENEMLKDFWEYNPVSNAWIQKKTFPGELADHTRAFSVQDKGYVATVLYSNNSGNQFQGKFWEYSPQNDEWIQKKDFPVGRQYGFSLGTDLKGYLGMGTTGWPLHDIYEYTPSTDSWTLAGEYPGNGHNTIGSFFIEGKIYMGMGSNNSSDSYSDFWEFDVEHQAWRQMQSCPTKLSPFISHTVGGKGYIGYGWYDLSWNDSNFGRAFYEFDPSKN